MQTPPTRDGLMSPGGRVYLEDKGHLETLPAQAGGRELNDLQEEPLALQRDLREARACCPQPSDERDPGRQPQHGRCSHRPHHTAQGAPQVQAEADKAVQEQAPQKRSKRVWR